MVENILSRMKKIKGDKWLIVLLAGILLLVICIPTKKSRVVQGTAGVFSWGEYGNSKNQSEKALTVDGTQMVTEENAEAQMKAILEKIEGVGQVEVMITANLEYNQIEGVVVVAEGADIPQVRQEIIETAQALFPIAAYKVKVCKMSGGQT